MTNINIELEAIREAILALDHLDEIQLALGVPISVRETTNNIINILIKREEQLIKEVNND